MWRAGHDGSASCGITSVPRVTPEMPGRPTSLSISQHPAANPTPFSSFPTAWSIGSTSANDYASHSARPSSSSQAPSGMAPAPSDLLPHGLLNTPQPSTPATTLLKVLASRGLTISGPEATYGNSTATNGTSGDSPGNSAGGVIPPLDSLVLPSPSLLPGGVHSLPTPTSASSQQPRAHESYGSRSSPTDPGSSKDSATSPRGEPPVAPKAQTHPSVTTTSKRPEQPQQQPFRSANGSSVTSGTAYFQGRNADVSSTSGHAFGAPHMQQVLGGYGGAAGTMPSQGHSGHQVGLFPLQPHNGHPGTAAGIAAGMPQAPGSPTVGYTQTPFYMSRLPPGHMMMGVHHHSGGGGGTVIGNNSRSSVGGVGPLGSAREGSAGSGWRGSRSGGGAGGSTGGGVGGVGGVSGRDIKQSSQYGQGQGQQQQQQIQGPLSVHDGAAGPYGMTHMHPGPYAVYGMMTSGIVVPQVLSSVVGSPRGMEAHGPLAHAPGHMGPMVMGPPGPPSMTVGMGPVSHMGMGPVHPFQTHGPVVPGSHIGMPPVAGPHHGGPPGVGAYPHMQHHHHHHSIGGGYQGNRPGDSGPGGGGSFYGQQSFGQSAGMHAHTGFYHAGPRGKGPVGGLGGAIQQQQGGYPGVGNGKGPLSARANGGSGGEGAAAAGAATGALTAAGAGRDSPLTNRARARGREKAEKSRAPEQQRERKPGNSRAPVVIAHCAADLAALDEQLRDLVQELHVRDDELAKHQAAFVAVREMVEARWPAVKVHLFGSAANGLSIAGANEIDVTLEVPDMAWDDHAAKAAMVSTLGELAGGSPAVAAPGVPEPGGAETNASEDETPNATEAGSGPERDAAGLAAVPVAGAEAAAGGAVSKVHEDSSFGGGDNTNDNGNYSRVPAMTAVLALPKARTPVVKLTVLETQTRVDITINNLLAISNTRLLRDYCKIDPRLRQLALLVKHWAKSRGVNDAYRGSLSSYAYVLLCIWLLQQRQPAILPVLQQRQPHTYDTTVGPWRCSYNDNVDELADFGSQNKESLSQLLVAFFDHWAWRHDYNGSVVCVRTGGTMAKSAKDWTKRQGNERHLMCIEDPFELSHDLGRTIDKAAVQVLRREFERAARIFASNPDPLPELLAPLTPEEEAAIAAVLQSRRKASKDKEKRAAAAAAAAAAADDDAAAHGMDGDAAAVKGDAGGELGGSGSSQPLSEPENLASRGSEDVHVSAVEVGVLLNGRCGHDAGGVPVGGAEALQLDAAQ